MKSIIKLIDVPAEKLPELQTILCGKTAKYTTKVFLDEGAPYGGHISGPSIKTFKWVERVRSESKDGQNYMVEIHLNLVHQIKNPMVCNCQEKWETKEGTFEIFMPLSFLTSIYKVLGVHFEEVLLQNQQTEE